MLVVAWAGAAGACRTPRRRAGRDDGGAAPRAAKARQPVPVSRHQTPRNAWRSQLEEVGIAAQHLDSLQKLVRPAIRLESRKVAQADLSLGQSRLGGEPDLPAKFKWPVYKGKPLAFVAQLNMEAVARVMSTAPLPKRGHLWFFYAADQRNWGFDPKDRGSSLVHHEADVALERRALPRELPASGRFQPCAIAMSSYVDIPSMEDERNPLMGSDDDMLDSYLEVQDQLASPNSDIAHKLLGHAQTIQGAMELECALTTQRHPHGRQQRLQGPPRGEAGEVAIRLAPAAPDRQRRARGDDVGRRRPHLLLDPRAGPARAPLRQELAGAAVLLTPAPRR